METLDQHNNRLRSQYSRDMEMTSLAGVLCPKCGTEMVYVDITVVKTSIPPCMDVTCLNCRYTDLKVI